jgi:hypothetical protein
MVPMTPSTLLGSSARRARGSPVNSLVVPEDQGVCPARACRGRREPWRERPRVDLEGITDAYAPIDERRAIKSLVRVGTL